ncbi:MAG: cell division protein SepF [Clostridia bacterium]|nr:cell division protein SepF [Clostridia bacterium]
MGKKFSDKILSFFGLEPDEDDDYIQDGEQKWDRQVISGIQRKSSNVISLHTVKNVKIIVMKPTSFEKVVNYATDLKNRNPVVLNFEGTDGETARRIIDFMSGVTYALEGSVEKINASIFAFLPNNVEIIGDIEDYIHIRNKV